MERDILIDVRGLPNHKMSPNMNGLDLSLLGAVVLSLCSSNVSWEDVSVSVPSETTESRGRRITIVISGPGLQGLPETKQQAAKEVCNAFVGFFGERLLRGWCKRVTVYTLTSHIESSRPATFREGYWKWEAARATSEPAESVHVGGGGAGG